MSPKDTTPQTTKRMPDFDYIRKELLRNGVNKKRRRNGDDALMYSQFCYYIQKHEEKSRKHSSTIFCSQYREEEWYEKFGGKDNPLTDAIMDRIAFDSYKIPIESLDPNRDVSMREVYGLDPSLAQ